MIKKFLLKNADSYELKEYFDKNKLKVNHIITDPPYNISQENKLNTLKNRKGVFFGKWDENFDLLSWIDIYEKYLDKNGSIIIFCSYLYISTIIERLKKLSFEVKDILIWQKNNPMPRNVNRRYVQDKEFAVWAVRKGAKWVFNKKSNKPYLRSTFNYPLISKKERLNHPTQKSLKLMEEIIEIHTNENDIIIDPFMGSGTTGEACLLHNRKFIGIEKEINFYEIAKKRMLKYDKN